MKRIAIHITRHNNHRIIVIEVYVYIYSTFVLSVQGNRISRILLPKYCVEGRIYKNRTKIAVGLYVCDVRCIKAYKYSYTLYIYQTTKVTNHFLHHSQDIDKGLVCDGMIIRFSFDNTPLRYWT